MNAQGNGADSPNLSIDGFCEALVVVTMAVIDGPDLVFAWSCLQHADEWATDLEATYGMVPERATLGSKTMKCGHQGKRPMLLHATDDDPSDVIEIDMDEVRRAAKGGVL